MQGCCSVVGDGDVNGVYCGDGGGDSWVGGLVPWVSDGVDDGDVDDPVPRATAGRR